jgi:hypothetical protein
MRLSPLGLWTPIVVAVLSVAVAFATREFPFAAIGGLILVGQGFRVAYNHQGVGERLVRWSPSFQFGYSSSWFARQMMGTMLVFFAIPALAYGFGMWR